MKTKLADDQRTYLNICQMLVDARQILEQYSTHWMPEKLQKPYVMLLRDISNIEIICEKLANVEFSE